MIALTDSEEGSTILSLLCKDKKELVDGGIVTSCERLKGDGSDRRIWRLTTTEGQSMIVVAPPEEATELAESAASWNIGLHLRSRNIPVPCLFSFDKDTGFLLCEDLGDCHLQQFAVATDFADEVSVEELRQLYREALGILIRMQVDGGENFPQNWCFDTSRYDKRLMLERESGYFLRAFWQGLLDQPTPEGLAEEFEQLAEIGTAADSCYFLHRDFQSRNIMVKDGRLRIIDFQGGRLGPLGYDLASLLLDPYACLPDWFQNELYQYYVSQIQRVVPLVAEEFFHHYQALRLQRNLQIIGAFTFLSTVQKKTFFFDYIEPALHSLKYNLQGFENARFPVMQEVARKGLELFCSVGADTIKR